MNVLRDLRPVISLTGLFCAQPVDILKSFFIHIVLVLSSVLNDFSFKSLTLCNQLVIKLCFIIYHSFIVFSAISLHCFKFRFSI